MKIKKTLKEGIPLISLTISFLTLILTSPFIRSWYTKPRLVFSNTNSFLKWKKEGTIVIKNVGRSPARDIVVFLSISNSDIKELEDAKFEEVVLVTPFPEKKEKYIIPKEKEKDDSVMFYIKEIPPRLVVGIHFKCDKSCSIPIPIIKYSEGEAKGVEKIQFD